MGFEEGHPRHGGRQKGTPNKDTQDLMRICSEHGLNVFEAMIKIAIECYDQDKKFDKLERIAQYLYPKRKALEHSTDPDSGIEVRIVDFRSK